MSSLRQSNTARAIRVITLLAIATGLAKTQTPTAFWNFPGTAGEKLGNSADGGEDVNGDGRPDLVVGSTDSSIAGPGFGTARVLSGPSGAVIWAVHGASAGTGFGTAVAMLGDINGDGRSEFAVSAPTDGGGGVNAGAVRVYSGLDGTLLFARLGAAGQRYGSALVAAGDVDLDGSADFLVGMPSANSGAGAAELVSGATQAALLPVFAGTGTEALGRFLAGRGDLNGDGIRDIVLGGTSILYLRSGLDGALIKTHALGADTLRSVAIVGDVDQDGRDEYAINLVTSFGTAGTNLYRSTAFLAVWGLTTTAGRIAAVGDVNGDCIPDLGTVEASGFSNANLVVRSGSSGAALRPALTYTTSSDAAFGLGFAIGRAGDVDADGFADVAVTAREDSLFGAPSNIGFARVYDLMFAGSPPSWAGIGLACPGSASNRAIARVTGCPGLGDSIAIAVANALPSAAMVLNVGAPISLALSTYGLPGCSLYATTDGFNLGMAADANGAAATAALTIPNTPAAVGALLAAQFIAVDVAANAVGLVTSTGVRIVVGD